MADEFEYFRRSNAIITGRHADLVDRLWKQNQIKESYIKRLVDIYMIAPIIGIRMQRSVPEDRASDHKRQIPLEQINPNLTTLDAIMKIIILLDETSGKSEKERIDLAFRGPQSEAEYSRTKELFNSYLRGGIETLYEELILRHLSFADKYSDNRIGNIVALLNNPFVLNDES